MRRPRNGHPDQCRPPSKRHGQALLLAPSPVQASGQVASVPTTHGLQRPSPVRRRVPPSGLNLAAARSRGEGRDPAPHPKQRGSRSWRPRAGAGGCTTLAAPWLSPGCFNLSFLPHPLRKASVNDHKCEHMQQQMHKILFCKNKILFYVIAQNKMLFSQNRILCICCCIY